MHSTAPSSVDQGKSLLCLILQAASLLLFIVIGIYGNGRVIHTVLLADVLRPALNLFIANLSIADLSTCIVIMPISFASLVSGNWLFGRIFCGIHGMLLVYFAHVAGLCTCAIVYERYRAIYRKCFPSLSHRQVTILLCIIWILPVVFVAPLALQDLSYAHPSGVCLNTYHKDKNWNTVFLVKTIIETSLGLLFVLFSFWKILAFLLPIRRRVSPGLMSNEEKLTVASHVRSTWTTIIFVLIYTSLVLPLHVARTVNIQRANRGQIGVANDVICAFLWLYWLQCAIKPVIYVARSERYTRRLCRCFSDEKSGEARRCFRGGNRASLYEVKEGNSENSRSNTSVGWFAALPPLELFNVRKIPDQAASQRLDQKIQDELVTTENSVDHSVVIIEEMIIKSFIEESEEEINCSPEQRYDGCHDDENAIPADVCYDAVELENIERKFNEALRMQQTEWELSGQSNKRN